MAAPWKYYDNNINGTLVLVDVMRRHGVKNIIFTSSATVYGLPAYIPFTENCPKGQIMNPYGRSQVYAGRNTGRYSKADPEWNVILLRYFNPIGAHVSGLIGKIPWSPENLLPYITQVAVGQQEKLLIYGNDYRTPDGTGVRDYIHVSDLAAGHVKALETMSKTPV